VNARLHVDDDLRAALEVIGVQPADDGDAVVFRPADVDTWTGARRQLAEAFHLSKDAAARELPVVYVVEIDALLGRSGPTPAMVATGLVSAARTLAVELKKAGAPVNTIAVEGDSDAATVAAWVRILLEGEAGAPTGEVIHLGGAQIGKALS
jgi:hypothetical protein